MSSHEGVLWAGLSKRLMDIGFSLAAIITCLPLLILIALAIRMDSPGPILFRQRRVGLDGRVFAIFKFRTLFVLEDGPDVAQVGADDARMTRVGRLLRPLFIDELPQLLNVLLGDMSLVGPRPHAVAHDAYYKERLSDYAKRHAVKPGMTGWAQVKGAHGATPHLSDMRARLDLDLWYIAHANITLDLLVLAWTPLEMLRSIVVARPSPDQLPLAQGKGKDVNSKNSSALAGRGESGVTE